MQASFFKVRREPLNGTITTTPSALPLKPYGDYCIAAQVFVSELEPGIAQEKLKDKEAFSAGFDHVCQFAKRIPGLSVRAQLRLGYHGVGTVIEEKKREGPYPGDINGFTVMFLIPGGQVMFHDTRKARFIATGVMLAAQKNAGCGRECSQQEI
ncbi:MAG TPA: hypothetical protein EYP63_05595 [Desulfotomaculum sp.]|nr:hypothetical protein [Desulfotomaculum sp.]